MKSINSYGDRYGSRYALLASLLALALVTIGTAIGAAPKPVPTYKQINLVSNVKGASHTDKLMINAWGLASLGAGDTFWINDEGSGKSELIDGKGNPFASLPLVTIAVPA